MESNVTVDMVNAELFAINRMNFIVMTLHVPIGILVNSLSLYIFLYREAKCNLQTFLTYMTAIDLVCCIVGVPLALVDQALPVKYPSGTLCKVQKFLLHFGHFSNNFTLFVMTAERFNSICAASKPQMNFFVLKKVIIIITVMSLALTVPIFLFGDRVESEVAEGVFGHVCSFSYPPHWEAYAWTAFAIWWASLVATFTLHFITNMITKKSLAGTEEGDMTDEQVRRVQLNKTLFMVTFLVAVTVSPYILLSTVPFGKGPGVVEKIKHFLIGLYVASTATKPIMYVSFDMTFKGYLKGIFGKSEESDHQLTATPKVTMD